MNILLSKEMAELVSSNKLGHLDVSKITVDDVVGLRDELKNNEEFNIIVNSDGVYNELFRTELGFLTGKIEETINAGINKFTIGSLLWYIHGFGGTYEYLFKLKDKILAK